MRKSQMPPVSSVPPPQLWNYIYVTLATAGATRRSDLNMGSYYTFNEVIAIFISFDPSKAVTHLRDEENGSSERLSALPKVTLPARRWSLETRLPGITIPVGIDRLSKFNDHRNRAGIICQVLLTFGMIRKRGTSESRHAPGAPRTW